MQLFPNIPDFWNSKSATLDFFSFLDVHLMILEKSISFFPFSRISKQAQWWHGYIILNFLQEAITKIFPAKKCYQNGCVKV